MKLFQALPIAVLSGCFCSFESEPKFEMEFEGSCNKELDFHGTIGNSIDNACPGNGYFLVEQSKGAFLCKNGSYGMSLLVQCRDERAQRIIEDDSIPLVNNAEVLTWVNEGFSQSLQLFFESTPILRSRHADTAFAHTSDYFDSCVNDFRYVGVSTEWDIKARDSIFWEDYYSDWKEPDDPVFEDPFKQALLSHESTHLIGDYLKIDYAEFYQAVEEWYIDETYGRPGPSSPDYGENRLKYMLWWNLYGQRGNPDVPSDMSWKEMSYSDRYQDATPGEEEFAYIAAEILKSRDERWRLENRLAELSPEIAAFFEGVLSSDYLK